MSAANRRNAQSNALTVTLIALPRMFKVAFKVLSSSSSRIRDPLADLVRDAPPLPPNGATPPLPLPARIVRIISNTLLQRLGDLRSQGVTPVIVFDGARMPAKEETRLLRAACVAPRCVRCVRCEARVATGDTDPLPALAFHCTGLHCCVLGGAHSQRREAYAKLLEAREHGVGRHTLGRLLARAVSISSQLRKPVLQGVREGGHEYIVSPYEADAQCAFLNRPDVGYVSAVITEDSDLVAFGATEVHACVQRVARRTRVV